MARLAVAVLFLLALMSAQGVESLAPTDTAGLPPVPARVHGRCGIYLTCYAVTRSGFLAHALDQLTRYGMDAVVVDVKNGHGEVAYASQVPLAQEIGAVSPRLDLGALVDKIHARSVYAIARQVVCVDPNLAAHLGSPGAPWVDISDARVAEYNLAIAREVAAAGFDEVQFDYIRYPDDGPIGPDYTARSQAIADFVALAADQLQIPVSVDLYGRVLWPWNARHIDPIGQHLESLAAVANVLSPMIYPSHYVESELRNDPFSTVQRAMTHGIARVDTPIRPFLQAFALALPPGMDLAGYIAEQIRAAESSGADGYLFWNPRADYSALWMALDRMGRSPE